jgi:hypothetical protein
MQFTLRSMLLVTAIIAGFCGLFLAVPDSIVIPVLSVVAILLLSASIALAVATHGTPRAFGLAYVIAGSWLPLFVGIAVPLMVIDSGVSDIVGPEVEAEFIFAFKWTYGAQFSFSFLAGGFAIAICRYCGWRSKINPPATIPISPSDASELYAILQGRMGTGAELISSQANQLTMANNGSAK